MYTFYNTLLQGFFSPSSVSFKFDFIKKVYPKGSKSIIYDAHGVWETLGYYDL
jgi:hypothetical protein